jgi:hypothetical protein
MKDDVSVPVPSVREKKKSVVCGFDLPAKIFGFDESNPYILIIAFVGAAFMTPV